MREFSSPQIRCLRENNVAPTPDPFLTTALEAVIPIQGATLGDTTVQLFSLATPLTAPVLMLAASNAITLHVSDQSAAQSIAQPFPTLTRVDRTQPARSADSSTLNTYTGWQAAFILTDTSFGKGTALLDQSTHLEWLRLGETRNKSQEQLRRNMSPHKALDGWRFATDDEVATFFRHFTGSPTGRTSDPAIVAELERLVGGPFSTSHSTPGNWTHARLPKAASPDTTHSTSGFAPCRIASLPVPLCRQLRARRTRRELLPASALRKRDGSTAT